MKEIKKDISEKYIALREFFINKILKELFTAGKVPYVVEIFRGEVDLASNARNEMRIRLFMELCENDLSKSIIKHPRVKIGLFECEAIMLQCMVCLAHLHSCGILHTDIKPMNILISDTLDVRFCDFGSADYIDPNGGGSFNYYSCTKEFASPEYLANRYKGGLDGYDFKHDVWSLGLVFFLLYQKTYGLGIAQNLEEFVNKKTRNGNEDRDIFCKEMVDVYIEALRYDKTEYYNFNLWLLGKIGDDPESNYCRMRFEKII